MLQVEFLSVTLGGAKILHQVSCTVPTHSIMAILGLNGAGKTTLVKAIAGLVPFTADKATFNNLSLKNLKSHEIAQQGIIYVPENKELFYGLSVQENLEVGALVKTLIPSKKHVQKLLQSVYDLFPKLKERSTQKVETLSGGEQQMVCIGRALMAQPKVLILDEPSQGLAPHIVQNLFNKIKDLAKAGMTIILNEQNIYAALTIADKAIVIENGIVIEEKSADKMMNMLTQGKLSLLNI
ncbi:MAG: ABC transporter ATP-binding protein [Alphaproteobacteria bacterium CG_4_10_14_0_8_um_filter_37_21]|nr:MAG: ABC transporter ATP-binding protein [Alphaproteobacteria bacterium CG_4_10_14_0_8_um_filter_37_21]